MGRILAAIRGPADLKGLSQAELTQLAREIRDEILHTVARTGGHLGPNLGSVELTLALHTVLDSPRDRIVWDVGHQAYPHKLVTGRRDRFHTLRQYGGISGFTRRAESPHDPFGAGHASTAISAALGMAVARDLAGEDFHVVAVVGDGALTGGMAYEALNNAGQLGTDLIVVLNDNEMSIAPNVGAISRYLTRLRMRMDPALRRVADDLDSLLRKVPAIGGRMARAAGRVSEGLRHLVLPGSIFEELGFTYLGPLDGHDIRLLQQALRDVIAHGGPVVLHVVTEKGRGYGPAEKAPDKLHGTSPFQVEGIGNGKPAGNGPASAAGKPDPPTLSRVMATTLVHIARKDPAVLGITAAMPGGTGLDLLAKELPDRFFDVGIAEQHGVTFAAGLACQGMRPVAAIYSTFLQRAYDQVIHDVCVQNLPVTLAIDRAGLVGDDGPTHHGAFDVAYLRCLPNMVVMAPKDEIELAHMLYTAIYHPGPAAVRYPKGKARAPFAVPELERLPIGRAELLREGRDVAVFALGPLVYTAAQAAADLDREGIEVAVVNARFAKPVDEELVEGLARRCGAVVTVEDAALAGGFGSAVLEVLAERGVRVPVRRLGIPDRFIEHGPIPVLFEECGLTHAGIAAAARELARTARRGWREGTKGLGSRRRRLDSLVAERGLLASRERARRAILAGQVYVDGRRVDKAGTLVAVDARVEVRGDPLPYVSRGGLKLQGALDAFAVPVAGHVCVDVGASTGGFSDCLLARGAARVHAVDVGRGQLHWKLRCDPRVVVHEGVNARLLRRDDLGEPVDLACIDVSFISLAAVLPPVAALVRPGGELLALIKPQFEVGPARVGRGGVVRDPRYQEEALVKVLTAAQALGLKLCGLTHSPLKGPKGNIEYFLYASRPRAGEKPPPPPAPQEWAGRVVERAWQLLGGPHEGG